MLVEITVVPGSGSFRLAIGKDGGLKVFLKSRPEGNRANIELVKELSRALGKPVRIARGLSSRHKTLELAVSESEWNGFIDRLRD